MQPEALTIHGVAHSNTASIEAESIGWIALGEGAYLQDDNATQVLVVGVAQAGDAVLLVG